MRPFPALIAIALLGIAAPPALAQQPSAAASNQTIAPAAEADVATIDGLMAALYDVISGDAGAPRGWDRFSGLFYSGATLIPTGLSRDGAPRARIVTPADYVRNNAPYFAGHAFFEREIGRSEERFGSIAHVRSAYESRDARDADQPFERGVNSLELFNDGTRWWIVSIIWAGETPDNPLPAEWLAPVNDPPARN